MQTNPADGMREEHDFSQGKRGAVVSHQGKMRITLDTVVKILCHVYPLRAWCNACVV